MENSFTVFLSLCTGTLGGFIGAFAKVWARMAYENWQHKRTLRIIDIRYKTLSPAARRIINTAYTAGMPIDTKTITPDKQELALALYKMGLLDFVGDHTHRTLSLSPLLLEAIYNQRKERHRNAANTETTPEDFEPTVRDNQPVDKTEPNPSPNNPKSKTHQKIE